MWTRLCLGHTVRTLATLRVHIRSPLPNHRLISWGQDIRKDGDPLKISESVLRSICCLQACELRKHSLLSADCLSLATLAAAAGITAIIFLHTHFLGYEIHARGYGLLQERRHASSSHEGVSSSDSIHNVVRRLHTPLTGAARVLEDVASNESLTGLQTIVDGLRFRIKDLRSPCNLQLLTRLSAQQVREETFAKSPPIVQCSQLLAVGLDGGLNRLSRQLLHHLHLLGQESACRLRPP
mmetsp:Transcript_33875/g.79205  ORF Transcript_33875/g.79205 Transcript_33875/m.79205 type:complete len:239 (-) Transcript_33875:1263-1979(-)